MEIDGASLRRVLNACPKKLGSHSCTLRNVRHSIRLCSPGHFPGEPAREISCATMLRVWPPYATLSASCFLTQRIEAHFGCSEPSYGVSDTKTFVLLSCTHSSNRRCHTFRRCRCGPW